MWQRTYLLLKNQPTYESISFQRGANFALFFNIAARHSIISYAAASERFSLKTFARQVSN